MAGGMVNLAALEPLFLPWEEPNAHRVRAKSKDAAAEVVKGRRPTSLAIAQNLRGFVRQWRESGYPDVSDTSRYLLDFWFQRSHRRKAAAGEEFEFRYYFCQREAIETLIYLKEVRGLNSLSQVVAEFGGPDKEIAALGITEEEDAWSRYAFKLATGAGKTKVMSLAIVWSYFHSLRETDSEMARHFVVVAPNLTVYERLLDDFKPTDRAESIFEADPLIPSEWRGDWNLSVVLQDEPLGASVGAVLYLTNVHRLYDPAKRAADATTYNWIGPAVSRSNALDAAEALRDRITKHPRILLLNDEAHHVWDPDSAWSEAIEALHRGIRQRGGSGVVAQLDFSATPKDNKGQFFKHIVCDTPLGEAVDGGIVKTPIIGQASESLHEQADENAAFRFERHLRLGYERWKTSREEWAKSGKKALLFVMCEDTAAADQIASRFDKDEVFKELNGRTINLHTNLKGRVKRVGNGANARMEFREDDKAISNEDLQQLRKLSRELDSNSSPYSCIVSVLMLREGWDVRNVTTIVPLRPYSAKAEILPEQTLGRGLRRMTPPGQATEVVTVVEHPAFAALYQQQLSQEGLPIEIVDVDRVPSTTVSIYPDEARKNVRALDIELPRLTAAHRQTSLTNLTLAEVKKAFEKFKRLPGGQGRGDTEIQYEGRHLLTGEVVEQLKINLPLLQSGVGAVSYYVKEIEAICRVRGTHAVLAPLLQTFLEQIVFEKVSNLFDPEIVSRLGDSDVSEHIRAVFVPLVRAKTTTTDTRAAESAPMRLSAWRPFQVTSSERSPVLEAQKTLFNLVTCRLGLEVAIATFLDRADDVVAFAKNAGPQSLRIDYLAAGGRLAFYTPDFFARDRNDNYVLIETKGREDKDVPRKARAAMAWCDAASLPNGPKWQYVYVPQGVFERLANDRLADLIRTCRPALQNLVEENDPPQLPLLAAIAEATAKADERAPELKGLVDDETLNALPPRYRKAVEQATMLFRFFENKQGMNYAPVFNALLGSVDEAARGLVLRRLENDLPRIVEDQKVWFDPYLANVEPRLRTHYQNTAQNLKRTLVFKNGLSPLGLLRSVLDYALNDNTKLTGVFEAVRTRFKVAGGRDLLTTVTRMNDFRNTYVAHQEKELTDQTMAEHHLKQWIAGLRSISEA
jgi:type III restriction enzyme